MTAGTLGLAVIIAAVWFWLLVGHSLFWLFADRDTENLSRPRAHWPSVVAIIPARNEADVIGRSLASVLAQDYPGPLRVILVDDQSDDGTAAVAEGLAAERLTIIAGSTRPASWTGKLWAQAQGIEVAGQTPWLWLTDADIGHSPDNLRRLVDRALDGRLVMVSLMARLNCTGLAERALIPAFVYFFAMLYPFARANRPGDRLAAAAGGCVLLDRRALDAVGGLATIRGSIIDDCALAAAIKPLGPTWLGLTTRAVSLRPYAFGDIRRMVARSAYAQLGHSPLALAGCLAGLALVYLAPPLLSVVADEPARLLGGGAWLFMAVTMLPILRFYGRSPLWAPLLPAIALVYAGFTLDSAIQHWRGRGGMWKGRAQAMQA